MTKRLDALGVEYRPIVAGNFARSEVVRHFDHELVGDLPNAAHIDKFGLFVGNNPDMHPGWAAALR